MKYRFNRFTVEVRPEGNIERFEIVHHDDVVAILPYDNEWIYLVEQPRPAVGKDLVEVVAGFIDKDEGPWRAAQRELREELGIVANAWQYVTSFYSSPGFTTEQVHLFLATDLVFGESEPDEDETIAVVKCNINFLMDAFNVVDSAKSKVAILALMTQRISEMTNALQE